MTAKASCTSAVLSETAKVIETVLSEENRKPESILDFVQRINRGARADQGASGYKARPGRQGEALDGARHLNNGPRGSCYPGDGSNASQLDGVAAT
jgi:hypothetical protein